MNNNDIDKLLSINTNDIYIDALLFKQEEIKQKKEITEAYLLYILVLMSLSTLILSSNGYSVTAGGMFTTMLGAIVITLILVGILGTVFKFLHDAVSEKFTYPSMRIREAEYKASCNEIVESVEKRITMIEGIEGFIWRFSGCIPHMNNQLNNEQLEDLIAASAKNIESINMSHYRCFVEDLKHYYKRAPVRDSFKQIVKEAGPCIKPEFV